MLKNSRAESSQIKTATSLSLFVATPIGDVWRRIETKTALVRDAHDQANHAAANSSYHEANHQLQRDRCGLGKLDDVALAVAFSDVEGAPSRRQLESHF
jgi:hypothetical protein